MDISFSMEYIPEMPHSETGFHKTLDIYKEDIIKHGFKVSVQEDDWLGEGVYFWDDINNAYWWKKSNTLFKSCIFVCELTCGVSQYLNLDNDDEMNNMETFTQQYLREMSKSNGYKPKFNNNNQRKKFFCDLYCAKNNYAILSFTFEHDRMNRSGFKTGSDFRRQICVRNPMCITIKEIKEVQ